MNDERNRTTGTTSGTTSADLDTTTKSRDANLDPISGEPGAHPVGTGAGALGGAATGAAIGGAVGGPVGAVIGAAVGGVAGGLAGKGIAESINPTEEDAFWRANFERRPYAQNRGYDEFGPAYRYGWETWGRERGSRDWNAAETDLEKGWNQSRGDSRLSWNDARNATRDAWDRLDNRFASGDRPAAGTGATLTDLGTGLGTGVGTGTHGVGVGMGLNDSSINFDTPGATGYQSAHTAGHSTAPHTHFGEGEDNYWRTQYKNRPYARQDRTYEDYQPAYQYGYDAAHHYRGRSWNEAENDLATGWERARGKSHLAWQDVKDAARDAWHRVEHALPGDADGDGR